MTTTYGTCTTLDICPSCRGAKELPTTYREERRGVSRWYDSHVTCWRCMGTGQVTVTIDLDVDDDEDVA